MPAGPSWNEDVLLTYGFPTDAEVTGDGSLIAIGKRVRTLLSAGALTPASGQVASSGNNLLITPSGGKALRIYYASYNPLGAVEAGFRFGAAGTLWLVNNVTANSVISKDFGDFRYLEGAVNQVLNLNLSLAVATNWTVLYKEI